MVYLPRRCFPRVIGWRVLVEGKVVYRLPSLGVENMFSLSLPPSLPSLKCDLLYLLLMSHVWKLTGWIFFLLRRKASVALNSLLWFSSRLRCWHGTQVGVKINVLIQGSLNKEQLPSLLSGDFAYMTKHDCGLELYVGECFLFVLGTKMYFMS